jgi:hypothetical protein
MKTEKIQVSVDELAAYITILFVKPYENKGNCLDYETLNEIYKAAIIDISTADFKETCKEFKELLYAYQMASTEAQD